MPDGTENNDGERFSRGRKLLRGLFGVILAASALGAFSSLGSDPLGALVAGVLFALAAGLVFRRTRVRLVEQIDRDVGTVGLGVAIIVLLSVAGAAAPASPGASDSAPGASAADNTPTPTPEMTATPAATTTTSTATATATDTPTATKTPTATATPTPKPSSDIKVRVVYDGEWSGAISAAGSTRSIQGTGATTIDVTDDASTESVNAQKKTSGSDKLTVQILKGDEVVKETSTTADYGVAQVSHSLGYF